MKSNIQFILSMITFGTIGIFVRHINLASSEIALLRGLLGSLFLLAVIAYSRNHLSWQKIRPNAIYLLSSSIALGANWIFLFESFKHTTISNATLSYYFAPVFVMMLSPLVLKETLSLKKIICIGIAILGMSLIVADNGAATVEYNHLLGICYGILAAGFYATLMLTNKFIKNLTALETTLIQLATASLVLTPYVLLTDGLGIFQIAPSSIPYVFVLGFLHTGVGFLLFFSGMQHLKGQTIAALSYIDPFTSLLISAVILKESMTAIQLIGGILLLGATFISEKKLSRLYPRKLMRIRISSCKKSHL